MRVISGKYRGKKLFSPKNDDIRPTTDKAKESLFNMLQGYVYQSKFLDLFSGSGAISVEAVSRGAKHVTTVEKSRASINIINANISLLQDEKPAIDVKNADVIGFLESCDEKYDIIFADPPYNYEKLDLITKLICEKNLLKDDGIMIMETDKGTNLKIPEKMYLEKEKIYSISKFSLIRYR